MWKAKNAKKSQKYISVSFRRLQIVNDSAKTIFFTKKNVRSKCELNFVWQIKLTKVFDCMKKKTFGKKFMI